jgi:DMSO/TMAO reductase YedYZ molybdopterin-dependent catalytic subunit
MVIRRLALGGILSWVWVALLIGRAAAEPLPDRVSGGVALRVSGAVQHPLTLTMPDLRALPAAEPSWERDGQSHRARGVDLLALVDRAGLKLDPAVKNHRLRFAVVATGGDGYQAVFSLGELMPSLGGKGAIAAYEQDGGPLAERSGPLELISAGDKAPNRWVRGLTELRVVDLNSTHEPKAPSHLGP